MDNLITRRSFIKGATYAGLGLAVGVSLGGVELPEITQKTRVVLIRDKSVLTEAGKCNPEVIQGMIDRAVAILFNSDNPDKSWKRLIQSDDIVGIKSNEWGPLPTPSAVEHAIRNGVIRAGVPEKNIDIADRDVLDRQVFRKATALVNVRPLRTHHWSGVGSLIKNYVMFVPEPWKYHDNSCADLAAIWKLPIVKDKTRLNILVMLTPLFHGVGGHHFNKKYTWNYCGLLVGTDPVALDAIGLKIFEAKRIIHFGENRPLKPPPHHIAFADTKHNLGVADINKIELVKLGWKEDILI